MFKQKSVDSILSALNKNITDLQAFAERQEALATVEEKLATQLVQRAEERRGEILRADLVANKLKSLIS